MLTSLGKKAFAWASAIDPWTNVYGVARTCLALGTLATLLFSPADALFRPGTGIFEAPICRGISQVSLFCFLPGHLELARWVAIGLLAVIASGWRPRITGIIHWWLSSGLFTSALLVDGGDQVTAVLTLLLLPVTLMDKRRWHWDSVEPSLAASPREVYLRLIALSCLVVVRVQVAGIYYQAAVSKFGVPEWANGTALYYWLTDPLFGVPSWLEPAVMPLLISGTTVVILTWGVLLVESLLFTGLVMDKRGWPYLLKVGIVFHIGIAVCQGLGSFVLAMSGALILFLRPVNQPFELAFFRRAKWRLASLRAGKRS